MKKALSVVLWALACGGPPPPAGRLAIACGEPIDFLPSDTHIVVRLDRAGASAGRIDISFEQSERSWVEFTIGRETVGCTASAGAFVVELDGLAIGSGAAKVHAPGMVHVSVTAGPDTLGHQMFETSRSGTVVLSWGPRP